MRIHLDTDLRIHLDTDLGGDADDACAFAMLLGWPGAEITGITPMADPRGRRAAYVAYLLRLASREDIPWPPRGRFRQRRSAADPVADLPRLRAAGPL